MWIMKGTRTHFYKTLWFTSPAFIFKWKEEMQENHFLKRNRNVYIERKNWILEQLVVACHFVFNVNMYFTLVFRNVLPFPFS